MLCMTSGRSVGFTQSNAVIYDAHYTANQAIWTTENMRIAHSYLGVVVAIMGGTKTECL